MSAAIKFEGITKRFGEATAVRGLNLEVEKGEFFSLLGPSGCGKTTTLRMVAGFEQPTEGRIFLEGEPVETVPPYQRNVNTVFQSYALFEHLDVETTWPSGSSAGRCDGDEIRDAGGARRWSSWSCAGGSGPSRASCRAGRSSAWRWRGRS